MAYSRSPVLSRSISPPKKQNKKVFSTADLEIEISIRDLDPPKKNKEVLSMAHLEIEISLFRYLGV